MRDSTRNVIVGLTMLLALGVCLYGVVLLGKFPGVGIRQYVVTVITSDAAGITSGSKVELNGVIVGQTRAPRLDTDPATGKIVVRIELLIDSSHQIPTKTAVTLARPSAGVGQSMVLLVIQDPTSPKLPQDGSAVLQGGSTEGGIIPSTVFDDVHQLKETLTSLSHDLSTVAKDLHVLLAYNTPEAIDKADPNDPNRPVANASTLIIRLDRTAKSLQDLLGDPKLGGQLRDAMQNISDASVQLKTTLQKAQSSLENVDKTVASAGEHANRAIDSVGTAATQASVTLQSTQKDISRVTDQLVTSLTQLDKSLKQITEGQGTTGHLINDPRLYDNLIDLSKSLKSSVDDLDFLINKWKDEGVNLHLK